MQSNKLVGLFQRLKASVSATTTDAQAPSELQLSPVVPLISISPACSPSQVTQGIFLLSSYNMSFILDFRQTPSWLTELRSPVKCYLHLSGHDGAWTTAGMSWSLEGCRGIQTYKRLSDGTFGQKGSQSIHTDRDLPRQMSGTGSHQ